MSDEKMSSLVKERYIEQVLTRLFFLYLSPITFLP